MAGTRWPALGRAEITVIGGGRLWDMSTECQGSGIHLVMFECEHCPCTVYRKPRFFRWSSTLVISRLKTSRRKSCRMSHATSAWPMRAVLMTTPEPLALLLSYPDIAPYLTKLRCVVVDEWHELLGNNRGGVEPFCNA